MSNLPPPLPRKKSLGDDAGVRLLLPVGRSGWAIAAGYMGLFSILLIPAPMALILGAVGWWDISKSKSSSNPKHGMGRVIFGLIAGLIGTGFLLFFVIGSLLK